MDREQLIDRRLEIEQMDLIDDIEEKIEELETILKYFDLKLSNLYCKN